MAPDLTVREEYVSAPDVQARGAVINETDLPDEQVMYAVETYFEEHASVFGGVSSHAPSLFNYAATGSLLTRPKFRVPATIVEEIQLARELAERDDDIGSAIGAMLAMAFEVELQNAHEDEITVALFDEVVENADLMGRFKEMYREWLIASQVTTATIFTRESFQFLPQGADRQRTRSIIAPLVGMIPADQIRVIGNDLFGTAELAYKAFSGTQENWLNEFFDPRTSAARKAEMRSEDPILSSILIGRRPDGDYMSGAAAVYANPLDPPSGTWMFDLNPAMVHRSTMPKGQWPHPRPLLTRNLPLIEAKRLLSIMDHAILEGGANFLVVAKKGTDQRPALPVEVENLRDTIRKASRSGVIIGDHRLEIEIITPNLTEMLNPSKRKMVGRKLATALLRLPDFQSSDAGAGQATITDTEIVSRVVSSDRSDLVRHMRRAVYKPTAKRNDSLAGAPTIWFPKIILQGAEYFTDLILKLRDRGDIPRKYAVEAAGINFTAAVEQRRLEKSTGVDKVLTVPPVPFSAAGPNDNNAGRPPGGSPANGAPGSKPSRSTVDPARQRQVIQRNAGETVKAFFSEETGLLRVGEQTYELLERHVATKKLGRVSKFERAALTQIADGATDLILEGRVAILPVNVGEEIAEVRAIRLADGLSVLVGRRDFDDALMARALVIAAGDLTAPRVEELALGWGCEIDVDDLSAKTDRERRPAP